MYVSSRPSRDRNLLLYVESELGTGICALLWEASAYMVFVAVEDVRDASWTCARTRR